MPSCNVSDLALHITVCTTDKEEHGKEGRTITAEYENFYLVTSYVPNSGRGLKRLDYRQEWDKDFRQYLKKLDGEWDIKRNNI